MITPTPDAPWMPHLSACGLMVCGGSGAGYNIGGKMLSMTVTTDNRSAAFDIEADSLGNVGKDDGNIFTFVNGSFSAYGGTNTYRASRQATQQVLTFDAFPLPPVDYWRHFKAPVFALSPPVVNLTWKGDDETTRYSVKYATVANKSDAKVVGRYSRNDYIEVTKLTNLASPDDIRVVGADGSSTGKSSYTVTVNKTGDTITVTVENDETLVTEVDAVEYLEYRIPFGAGLFVDIPNGWVTSGDTEFTVKAGPKRSFNLTSGTSDDHYFQVQAERLSETPVVSAWKSRSIEMPPNSVSDINVSFVSASSVTISFDMPSDTDIAGWRLYLSPHWRSGHYMPHYYPVQTGTAEPGATVNATLTGLVAGRYTFLIRAYDESGNDDMSIDLRGFFLSATAVSYDDLTTPLAFKTEASNLSQVALTAVTDKSEDRVYIYWNGGSGEIDYINGIWDIIPKTSATVDARRARYSKTYYNVPAGTYKFGIRSERNGEYDGNTNVTDTVTVNDTAIDVPYDLEIEVASNG